MQFLSPSWWLILVCVVLIGGSYAVLVKYNASEVSKQLKWFVWSLRSLAIIIIGLLLAQPVFEISTNEIQKPSLYLAYDVSNSMQPFENDIEQIKTVWNDYSKQLLEKYEVHEIRFGQNILLNEDNNQQQATNYSMLAKHIESIRTDRKNQLVVVSDGIFNQGLNPLYDNRWNYPIHTIAIGDTSVKKDLFIQEIRSNKSVFKGNDLPVNISVVAELLEGEKASLTISENGKLLFEQQLTINNPSMIQEVNAAVKLKSAGEHKLIATVKTNADEPKANNTNIFYVTVQETKKRIVCIAEAPHPDVRMLVNAWKQIPEYEVSVINSYERVDTLTFTNIDLLVIHKPTTKTWTALSGKLKNMPIWWITGMSPANDLWNKIPTGITLNKGTNQTNEIGFAWNSATNVFNLSLDEIEALTSSAPVQVPFGEFKVAPSVQTVVYQKVGNLQTNYPLVSVNTNNNVKHGVWIGEGFYKWQLNTFNEDLDQSPFEQLVLKYTRLLMTKENKKPLVCYAESSINEGDKWKVTANVFNASYEPTNEAEVQLDVIDSVGNKLTFDPILNGFDFQFLVTGLAAGPYKYQVNATLNNNNYKVQGNVLVKALNLEQFNTKANFDLLRAWSNKTNGLSVTKQQFKDLIGKLVNDAPPTLTLKKTEQKQLIDLWYVLIIPVVLIGSEWFIRKRNGMN